MEIIELATGIKKAIIKTKAEDEDIKLLVKKRFSFVWKTFKRSTTIYKLQIEDEDGIHYMQKYYMEHAGWQLYLEGNKLNKLLKEYL